MKFAESWTSSRPCRLGTAPPAAVTVIGEPAVPPFLIETSPVYVPSNRHPISPASRLWASLPTVLYGSLPLPPRLASGDRASPPRRAAATGARQAIGGPTDSARGIILSPAAGPS